MHSFIPQFIATLGGNSEDNKINKINDKTISATFGAFSLGNVIAWPSSALLSLTDDIDLTKTEENWTVSIFMLGAALVPWLAGQTIIRHFTVVSGHTTSWHQEDTYNNI